MRESARGGRRRAAEAAAAARVGWGPSARGAGREGGRYLREAGRALRGLCAAPAGPGPSSSCRPPPSPAPGDPPAAARLPAPPRAGFARWRRFRERPRRARGGGKLEPAASLSLGTDLPCSVQPPPRSPARSPAVRPTTRPPGRDGGGGGSGRWGGAVAFLSDAAVHGAAGAAARLPPALVPPHRPRRAARSAAAAGPQP